jgi:hypothetical protein
MENLSKQEVNKKLAEVYLKNSKDLEKTLNEMAEIGIKLSKKSAIGKLQYLKLYQKMEKPTVEKTQKITKKEIIEALEIITELDLYGLIEAKKDTLISLLEWLKVKTQEN